MDHVLELCGSLLARGYAYYGLALFLLSFTFANFVLLGAVVWSVAARARGARSRAWPCPRAHRLVRLAVEAAFGLINPVLYLAVLNPGLPGLRSDSSVWHAVLASGAWVLLAAFWTLRTVGAALDLRSPVVRAGVRALLAAALFWLLLFAAKDARFLAAAVPAGASPVTLALLVLRLCPLYLVPAVLLWDYIRAGSASSGSELPYHGLFLLPGGSVRIALAGAATLTLVTIAAATHQRSDTSVRQLIAAHRGSIRAAADQYDVDPRLIASLVYVTHRDQLTPFRDAVERVVISAWAMNLRAVVGIGPPDRVDTAGTEENPLLNRAFDLSVGLVQIKPRTAQTASVLAGGLTPDQLPLPTAYAYRDVEPVGGSWMRPGDDWAALVSPIPVPALRREVADVLLDDRSNLAVCALILALYQRQWESANRDWSLRERPEILATLYQIGFARSKPHAAPRSNAFGSRVREVFGQPWLEELIELPPAPRPNPVYWKGPAFLSPADSLRAAVRGAQPHQSRSGPSTSQACAPSRRDRRSGPVVPATEAHMVSRPIGMNAFEFVVVSALRAAQLMKGCTPRVPAGYKHIVTAQLEVAAGKVAKVIDPPGTPHAL